MKDIPNSKKMWKVDIVTMVPHTKSSYILLDSSEDVLHGLIVQCYVQHELIKYDEYWISLIIVFN